MNSAWWNVKFGAHFNIETKVFCTHLKQIDTVKAYHNLIVFACFKNIAATCTYTQRRQDTIYLLTYMYA